LDMTSSSASVNQAAKPWYVIWKVATMRGLPESPRACRRSARLE
jgi:hypothetical protein